LDAETLRAWTREAPPVPFFLAQALLPLIGVPSTPFFIMAGAAFGVPTALIGTLLGVALNLAMSHWIASSGLRPVLVSLLARGRYRLPEIGPGHGARFTLMVRLFPAMPAFMKNYLLCLAGVPFAVFFPISMVTSCLYAVSFVLLGESILKQDLRLLVPAVAGLVIFWLLSRLLVRRFMAQRTIAPPVEDDDAAPP
jgi:uncharacterized membrane protein YdjX (TVP38/TMEM64 family)